MTRCSSSTVVNVPVITQRRLYSGRASDSVHCQSRGQTSCATGHGTRLSAMVVYVAMSGFFDAFCVIFRAPPVVPELSASFWSPRRRRVLRCRGLPCQFMTVVLWRYTHHRFFRTTTTTTTPTHPHSHPYHTTTRHATPHTTPHTHTHQHAHSYTPTHRQPSTRTLVTIPRSSNSPSTRCPR